MASNRVITAPLAIIKVNGEAVGKMRGLRVNENIQRGRVQGLGELTPQELPALSWAGTVTCDFFNIDFNLSSIPGAIARSAQTIQEFIDSLLLQEDGVQLNVYKKVKAAGAPSSGIIPSEEQIYCTINGLFLDTESFDINEGQVSGRNQSFTYLYPIIFPT
jgi:hypothetical protein